MKPWTFATAVALILLPGLSHAQGPALDSARQQAIIDKTIQLVIANYVYPERAKAVEATLRSNVRAGKYVSLTRPDEFLDTLNNDMQVAGQDKHLRVIYNPRMAAQLKLDESGATQTSPEFVSMMRKENFRLRKAESLEGNVGYFKLDNFVELRFVSDALVGAMNFLHNSSALIIDLTDNGGGASETSDLLVSYFLPAGTRTSESWDRTTNKTRVSTVTLSPEVRQLLDIPLFVIVSERTASAAEAVAYTLQQAKRAVVVGSRTKGMANPGRHFLIDDRLLVMVPTTLNKNAVSGTNWEGTGVAPDIEVASVMSLDRAMEQALKCLAERESDAGEKYRLRFLAQPYAARVTPQAPPDGFLEACPGEYEDGQRIVMDKGALHYVKGETNRSMSYMGDHTFMVEGRTDYRLKFGFDGTRVTRLEVLWFDDTSELHSRTN
jgi:hypothetical protein